jgi:hypothetical protein
VISNNDASRYFSDWDYATPGSTGVSQRSLEAYPRSGEICVNDLLRDLRGGLVPSRSSHTDCSCLTTHWANRRIWSLEVLVRHLCASSTVCSGSR